MFLLSRSSSSHNDSLKRFLKIDAHLSVYLIKVTIKRCNDGQNDTVWMWGKGGLRTIMKHKRQSNKPTLGPKITHGPKDKHIDNSKYSNKRVKRERKYNSSHLHPFVPLAIRRNDLRFIRLLLPLLLSLFWINQIELWSRFFVVVASLLVHWTRYAPHLFQANDIFSVWFGSVWLCVWVCFGDRSPWCKYCRRCHVKRALKLQCVWMGEWLSH